MNTVVETERAVLRARLPAVGEAQIARGPGALERG